MRIAMVSEHASPLAALGGVDAGGQNVHVDALSRGLAARGHEVVVHTRRDHPAQPTQVRLAAGLVVHHVDAGPARPVPKDELVEYLPQFTSELAGWWLTRPPEIIHAHFWMSGVISAPAASALGLPLAVTFHALGSEKRRHQADADTSPPCRVDAERTLARHADRVIATARREIDELAGMGVEHAAISVVPCGVDITQFDVDGPVAARGRPFRLVSVGRLVPRKGNDDAIRMLAEVPACELIVAGGPPAALLSQDHEVARLRALAMQFGVADRVRFTGAVARPDVPALFRSADAVLSLPWYEPFGLVAIEAMACGRPVIGSAVGGMLDTIEDGRTGLLVPARNPQAAAIAVRQLMGDAERRQAMGREARRRVVEHYDVRRVAEATEAVYHSMLAHPPARPIDWGRAADRV